MRYAVILVGCCACSFHPNSSSAIDAPAVPPDAAQSMHDASHVSADAAIDAPPDAPKRWVTLEMLTVPCLNQGIPSTTVLASGVTYHLRASGECITNTSSGSKSDAEYIGYNITQPVDVYSGVDYGIAINDLTEGSTKQPHWGDYTTTHVYEVSWVGAGATITAEYHDADNTNNSGSLSLEILSYQ